MIIMASAPPCCFFRPAGVLLFILFCLRNNGLLNRAYSIKRWQTCQRFPVHPDCKGLAHHQVVRHGAPESAVVTVVRSEERRVGKEGSSRRQQDLSMRVGGL